MGPGVEPEFSRSRVPGIAIEERRGCLRLVHRWFSRRIIWIALYCVLYDGFLIFGVIPTDNFVSPFVIFLGLYVTYFVLSYILNSTVIDVGMGQLKIRHGPLPWPGNRLLNSAELTQVFSERAKYLDGSRSYRLNAVRRDERKIKLVSGLDADQALFLEEQIEARLGLRD